MTKAVLATFCDARPVKSRSVLQLVLEVPIEQADDAMKMLGGFPLPSESRWVGIALAPKERAKIEAPAEHKDRKPFNTLPLSQQAGIRCNDPAFKSFLDGKYPALSASEPAAAVRMLCAVRSRGEFDKEFAAGERWEILDAEFKAWLTDQQYAESAR